jgi:hypothetical protein
VEQNVVESLLSCRCWKMNLYLAYYLVTHMQDLLHSLHLLVIWLLLKGRTHPCSLTVCGTPGLFFTVALFTDK